MTSYQDYGRHWVFIQFIQSPVKPSVSWYDINYLGNCEHSLTSLQSVSIACSAVRPRNVVAHIIYCHLSSGRVDLLLHKSLVTCLRLIKKCVVQDPAMTGLWGWINQPGVALSWNLRFWRRPFTQGCHLTLILLQRDHLRNRSQPSYFAFFLSSVLAKSEENGRNIAIDISFS